VREIASQRPEQTSRRFPSYHTASARARARRREHRLHPVEGRLRTTGHQPVADFQTPDAAAHAHIQKQQNALVAALGTSSR
jgi:hypothetical protein